MNERTMTILGCALWAFISLCLMARIWVLYRRERFRKKLFWTAIVMVPFFGWIICGAFFKALRDNDTACEGAQGIDSFDGMF